MKGPGTQRTRRRRATLSMKVARLGGVCLMLAAGTTLAALPAAAHRSPANCTANNLTLDIARDKTLVRNGDTINYTVIVSPLRTRDRKSTRLNSSHSSISYAVF